MNIFVLEDNFVQQSYIESLIRDIFQANKWQYTFLGVYGKPCQLIEKVTEKGEHQLFFLDIEIKNESEKGLEIAKQIRDIDPYASIVFVTTHTEFMPLSFQYQLGALDYIDKNLPQKELKKRIQAAIVYVYERQGNSAAKDSFFFKSKQIQMQIPFHRILYIETSQNDHKVILYTDKDRIEFYGKLSDIAKANKGLYKCHRSFVVNPANIEKIDKKRRIAYFRNGGFCFIARTQLKSLVTAMEDARKGDKSE